jgi:hypothetical protein
MASLMIYIIALLIIVALIIFVIIFRYNRHLDKVAKGEVHDTHSSIPEPRTAAGVSYKIVLMVIVIMTFIGVSTVSGIVSSMQSRMNNLEYDNRNLNILINQMQEDIKKQSSHVEEFTYNLGDADLGTYTVPVDTKLVLKEYTEDTDVALVAGGNTYEMNNDGNGIYSLRIDRSIFDDDYEARIVIKEPGRNYSEYVDFPSSLYYDYFPMPNLNCSFSYYSRLGKMVTEGNYTMLMGDNDDIESVTATYICDGQDIKSVDITDETFNQETIYLDKDLDVKRDLSIRFTIVTKSGFRIEQQQMMIYEDANYPDDYEYCRIYDPNGKLLWEDDFK